MLTGDHIDPVEVQKIRKIKCKIPQFEHQVVIVGGSGRMAEIMEFMDWVEHDGLMVSYKSSSESAFFLVNEEGIWSFESYYKPIFVGTINSFGSGSKYAMGAMYAGASPAEAVNIAAELDLSTGRGIYVLDIKNE